MDDKVKILIVDDLPEKLVVYHSVLQELGEELVLARSGIEALKHLLQADFAVILLDVNMPEMDGYETAALIRARKRCAHTPIIFITAFADELHEIKGYSHGAVDYILAPIVPDVLRTKVRVFVDLFRLNAQVKAQAARQVALAERERAHLAAVLETSTDFVARVNAAGGIIYLNSTGRRMLGMDGVEDSKAIDDLRFTIDDSNAAQQLNRQSSIVNRQSPLVNRQSLETARREGVCFGEAALPTRAGQVIHVSQVILAHKDEGGEVESYSIIAHDITERKRAEAELAQQHARLEEVAAATARELQASHERLRLADRLSSIGTLAAGLGHDMGNLLLPVRMRLESLEKNLVMLGEERVDVRPVDGSAIQVLRTGSTTSGEATRRCNDRAIKRVLPARQSSVPQSDTPSLAAATASAASSLALCTEPASANHQGGVDVSACLEDVQAIKTASEYLRRLSQGLRLFAMDPDDGRGSSTEPTMLANWWVEVEPFLRNALPKGIVLDENLPAELPAIAMPPHVFTQVIYNLVQNAGEVMRKRGAGRVRISAERKIDDSVAAQQVNRQSGIPFVLICVSDDGPGMADDVRLRCMEPFFTTKTRSISTGLGLALVRAAVIKAGGTIDIESQPGCGTTFRLNIPAAGLPHMLNLLAGTSPEGAVERKTSSAWVSLGDARLGAYVGAVLRSLDVQVTTGPWSCDVDAELLVVDGPPIAAANSEGSGSTMGGDDLRGGVTGGIADSKLAQDLNHHPPSPPPFVNRQSIADFLARDAGRRAVIFGWCNEPPLKFIAPKLCTDQSTTNNQPPPPSIAPAHPQITILEARPVPAKIREALANIVCNRSGAMTPPSSSLHSAQSAITPPSEGREVSDQKSEIPPRDPPPPSNAPPQTLTSDFRTLPSVPPLCTLPSAH